MSRVLRLLLLSSLSALSFAPAAGATGQVFYRLPDETVSRPVARIDFPRIENVLMGGHVVSAPVRFEGSRGVDVVTDGGLVRTCDAEACLDGEWRTAATIRPGQYVQMRVDGPTRPGAEVTAGLRGIITRGFSVTARATPAAFAPLEATTAERGKVVESGLSRFGGWQSTPISITGGSYRVCQSSGSCGAYTTDDGLVRDGDDVQVRVLASEAFEHETRARVSAGGAVLSWSVTTPVRDVLPDDVSFAAITDAEPGVIVQSERVVLAGFDGPLPITVAGGMFSLDDGTTWADTGQVEEGDLVRVRLTAGDFGAVTSARLRVGDRFERSFEVTTRARRTTVAPFTFTSVSDAVEGASIVSAPVTLAGFDGDLDAIVTGGEVSVDDGAWTASVRVREGSTVRVRLVSGAAGVTAHATLSVGDVSARFEVTTRAELQPLVIPAVTNASVGHWVVSAPVSLDGYDRGGLAIADGSHPSTQYRVCSPTCVGGYTTAPRQSIPAGSSLQVRMMPSEPRQTVEAVFDVGGVRGSWQVTARTYATWLTHLTDARGVQLISAAGQIDNATYGVGKVGAEGVVIRTEADGVMAWGRPVVGGTSADVRGVATSSDGSVYAAATLRSAGRSDIALLKYGSGGEIEWSRAIEGPNGTANHVAVASDGVYVVGAMQGRAVLAKYSFTGVPLWGRAMPDVSLAFGVDVTVDGVIVSGYAPDNHGSLDIVAVKHRSDGTQEWGSFYGTPVLEAGHGMAVGPDGSTYIAGRTGGVRSDATVMKLSPSGEVAWARALEGAGNAQAIGIAATANGVFISGEMADGPLGGMDAVVTRLTADGDRAWDIALGTSQSDSAWGIDIGRNGMVQIAGSIGSAQAFVASLDPAGVQPATMGPVSIRALDRRLVVQQPVRSGTVTSTSAGIVLGTTNVAGAMPLRESGVTARRHP